jgi:hypothetical protein
VVRARRPPPLLRLRGRARAARAPREPARLARQGPLRRGFAGADSELPLLREGGRLLYALGDLADAPAVFLEGLFTANARETAGGAEKLVAGTGGTITAALNLPFFFVTGPTLDLGKDADRVNEALAVLERPERKRFWQRGNVDQEWIFPPGTRVRASGRNLIWTIPGRGDVIQAGEWSPLFWAAETVAGTSFMAQERSWGMIVRDRAHWDARGERGRAETAIHEFYHQYVQIRGRFHGWSTLYWPAYGVAFPFGGWNAHWAERTGRTPASVVDAGLAEWSGTWFAPGPKRR